MMIQVDTDLPAPRIEIFADKDALCASVAERLVELLRSTVEADGVAHVALTGGGAGIGTLAAVSELLRGDASAAPDWRAVHFWWGDERLLPAGDAERNAQQAHEALLEELIREHGLPEANVHPMAAAEQTGSPDEGAERYAAELASHAAAGAALPEFAVVLLGVGPDGHVASLFPGRDALATTGRSTVGEHDSPKPPPARISLTFDAIHSARRVWTVVAGADKAEAVGRAFEEATPVEEIPAKKARGAEETIWHVDAAAAERL
ncbi:6-phosphogluconolactonase [Nesterenkonia sp. F]|uniref:6-phosphogluconolactonase n=1 Tax=Nesterenkonia sp. F TaxID=795955 RepID=UPI000255D1EB|nr:6-phosphogluconolactonase [Nesterenkonia sp. F]